MLTVDCCTIKNYIDLLEKTKIIYPRELFDLKSKKVLDSEKILFGRFNLSKEC